MIDASTSLKDATEAVRDDAHDLWQKAIVSEQAAWELYRGEDFDHQAAWQHANDIRLKTQVAYDQLDRACKAMDKTAGIPMVVHEGLATPGRFRQSES